MKSDLGRRLNPGGIHKMMRAIGRPRIGRLGFYIGAVAIALAAWQFQRYISGQQIFESQVESLTQLQEQQLQAFLDMNRLLTTLGTTMLGALGFLLASGSKGQARSNVRWSALASGAFAGISVFFGYVASEGILFMLRNEFFDLEAPVILWPHTAHFYALLLSVFFFSDFAIHDLNKEDRSARS
jgi:hypothetical protein